MENMISEGKMLEKKLFNKKECGWKGTNKDQRQIIFDYCDDYIKFLNNGKTEREIISESKIMADKNGFKDINEYKELRPGDKVYYIKLLKHMIIRTNIFIGSIFHPKAFRYRT